MKITKRQLRRIIKEQISATPTGRVEVEWDFSGVEGFTDDGLSYEEAEEKADLPLVIDIPDDVMAQFHAEVAEYGESQAEYSLTDWLSEEFGWLHHGWSWV